jgi:PAS domain S-box-containing protein
MGNMAVQFLSQKNDVKETGNNNGYPGMPITEIIINGFFILDRKWTVKYWNKAAERILGVQAKDIVGNNFWEKFAGAIPLNFYTVYHKAFQQDIPFHFEEYWAEMGAWFDVITWHTDDTLCVSFKNINQPAQSQPEKQLKMLNELYRFVTEVTNNCLWEWDLQVMEMFWIDGGHKKFFGYPIENAIIPQSFWESRIHPDDKERVLARLNKIIAEGCDYVWEVEYRFQKANGSYAYVHDRGHIIYDGNNMAARIIGATQDISAGKSDKKILKSGTQLLDDKKSMLIQKIKNVIIGLVHYTEEPLAIKFSEFLSGKLNHDYTYLSNLFSAGQGITIEKFLIAHKIERVKELLQYNEHSLTKIALMMHYSSVAHLSSQFKKVTGMTPSYFKQLRQKSGSFPDDV